MSDKSPERILAEIIRDLQKTARRLNGLSNVEWVVVNPYVETFLSQVISKGDQVVSSLKEKGFCKTCGGKGLLARHDSNTLGRRCPDCNGGGLNEKLK